ncbi:MAG: hypothetical protein AAF195_03610, partial [Pseudomonadota bacterium]
GYLFNKKDHPEFFADKHFANKDLPDKIALYDQINGNNIGYLINDGFQQIKKYGKNEMSISEIAIILYASEPAVILIFDHVDQWYKTSAGWIKLNYSQHNLLNRWDKTFNQSMSSTHILYYNSVKKDNFLLKKPNINAQKLFDINDLDKENKQPISLENKKIAILTKSGRFALVVVSNNAPVPDEQHQKRCDSQDFYAYNGTVGWIEIIDDSGRPLIIDDYSSSCH